MTTAGPRPERESILLDVNPVEDVRVLPRRLPSMSIGLVAAIGMLAVVVFIAFVVPFLPHYAPLNQNLSDTFQRPFTSWSHIFGTDPLGRDILSRLSSGARNTLLIVIIALAINILIGVVLGMMAGLGGGILETLIMGFADFQLSVPLLILIVTVIAVLGSSPTKLAVVIGISYWVGYARISRVIALSLREREFVLASRTQGAGAVWIMRKHILPSIIPQLWIVGSFNVGALVIVEASLSYLGLGVQAPQASLGGMIFDGQAYLTQDSWLCIIPGIVIFMIVAGVQIASTQFTDEGAPHRVGMSEGVS